MTPVSIKAGIGIAASIAAALAVTLAIADWRSARQARSELKICRSAAEDAGKPLAGCTGKVAVAIVAMHKASACDAALAAGDLLGVRSSCSDIVQDTAARLSASEANLADARRQLDQAEQRAIAAVSRAEARAATSAERKARAQTVIASAPRRADGIVTCDAACLRGLAGLPSPDR